MEMIVGDKYLIDGEFDAVLVEYAPASESVSEYAVFEVDEEVWWEMWYGKTEYYTKEGWHGVDGEGSEDEEGAVIVKK